MDQALLDWFRTDPAESVPEPAPPTAPEPPALTPAAFAAAPPEHRGRLLDDYLRQEIGRVLDCPAEAVARDRTTADLGIGSMTGLELRTRIEATLGAAPELAVILRARSVPELAAHLEDVLA
ncbi:acyl carrier protein [Streptomyces cinereoruber]|uniref:acyl carrier protein n=1 Tax=Streptomyces cinereoruber TaxID=67260 RepID=UPI00363F7D1D